MSTTVAKTEITDRSTTVGILLFFIVVFGIGLVVAVYYYRYYQMLIDIGNDPYNTILKTVCGPCGQVDCLAYPGCPSCS